MLLLSIVPGHAQEILKPGRMPAGIKFQSTTYSAYSGNNKLWEIQAERVEGDPKRPKAANLHGTLYRKGKTRYTLESSVAYINTSTSDMYFPKGAVFKSPSGEEIKTHILLWKANEKRFLGSKGVWMRNFRTEVEGDRMILDQSYDNVKLEGHVKSVMTQ